MRRRRQTAARVRKLQAKVLGLHADRPARRVMGWIAGHPKHLEVQPSSFSSLSAEFRIDGACGSVQPDEPKF